MKFGLQISKLLMSIPLSLTSGVVKARIKGEAKLESKEDTKSDAKSEAAQVLARAAPLTGVMQLPSHVVAETIWDSFLPYREMDPVGKISRLGENAPLQRPTRDMIVKEMDLRHYFRIDAVRRKPRGNRSNVIILIIYGGGKFAHQSPELRSLLTGLESDPAAKDEKIDSVILVVEDDFLGKRTLLETVRTFQSKEAGGEDPTGVAPIYQVIPYRTLSCNIPEHKSVQRHRLMPPDGVAQFLNREQCQPSDLPLIFSTDPPVIWLGGRVGQFVEITRDSETALEAIVVRRIVKGEF